MSEPETKNEPTLSVDDRHPSAIMIYIEGFEDCIPVKVAMVLNGNGLLDAGTVAKLTTLFSDAPETRRQRYELLAVIRRLVETRGKPRREEWLSAEACRAATDAHAAALTLLGECENTDAP